MFYSEKTNAFYPTEMLSDYENAGTLPDDLVQVTDDEWQTYGLGQPPAGKQRGADADGRPCWVDLPPTPLADLATQAKARIESAYDSALGGGMPYTMPDGSDDVVQTRAEDEPNLLSLAIEARDLRTQGVTDAVLELRTLSNTIYQLTPAQMIEVTDAAKTFKKQLLGRSWHRKDQIDAALADDTLSDDEKRAAIEAVAW